MKLGLAMEFDAAHHLPGYDGKCSRVHGHTYTVEVVIEGPIGDDGFVIDFYDLKKIVSRVLEDLDHNDLNSIMQNPTAEMIASDIYQRLKTDLEKTAVSLLSVKLWEGKNKWVMLD